MGAAPMRCQKSRQMIINERLVTLVTLSMKPLGAEAQWPCVTGAKPSNKRTL